MFRDLKLRFTKPSPRLCCGLFSSREPKDCQRSLPLSCPVSIKAKPNGPQNNSLRALRSPDPPQNRSHFPKATSAAERHLCLPPGQPLDRYTEQPSPAPAVASQCKSWFSWASLKDNSFYQNCSQDPTFCMTENY